MQPLPQRLRAAACVDTQPEPTPVELARPTLGIIAKHTGPQRACAATARNASQVRRRSDGARALRGPATRPALWTTTQRSHCDGPAAESARRRRSQGGSGAEPRTTRRASALPARQAAADVSVAARIKAALRVAVGRGDEQRGADLSRKEEACLSRPQHRWSRRLTTSSSLSMPWNLDGLGAMLTDDAQASTNQPPLDRRPRALEAYFAPAEGTRSPTRDRSSSISMQPPGTKWA